MAKIFITLVIALLVVSCRNVSGGDPETPGGTTPELPRDPVVYIFEPPEATQCYIETTFAISDKVGFFSGIHRKLWSFDIETFTLCDVDGLDVSKPNTLSIHANIIGCCTCKNFLSEEVVVFIDVSDPTNLKEKCWAEFDSPVYLEGVARVDFSLDGKLAAVGVAGPDGAVYIFKTSTGELVEKVSTPGTISHLDVFGADNSIGAVKISDNISGLDSRVYLLLNYMTVI